MFSTMADRACRNFKPNVFNNNKCQNCFKLREAHSSSVTASDVSFQSLTRKQSAQKVQNTESSIDSKTVYFTLYISLYIYIYIVVCNSPIWILLAKHRSHLVITLKLIRCATLGLFKNPNCGQIRSALYHKPRFPRS